MSRTPRVLAALISATAAFTLAGTTAATAAPRTATHHSQDLPASCTAPEGTKYFSWPDDEHYEGTTAEDTRFDVQQENGEWYAGDLDSGPQAVFILKSDLVDCQ
ncbi:hypothetical protein ACIO1C_14465 [Streptomyces sp. NPDC087420]|uniref:hypothetical protein n=1 Tax=Streptomyces sp. NPDC087420 TaxID=3365785 RepID=UPI003835478B